MKIHLDVQKGSDNEFVLALRVVSTNHPASQFACPIGKDLKYALYKGITLDIPALETMVVETPNEPPVSANNEGPERGFPAQAAN